MSEVQQVKLKLYSNKEKKFVSFYLSNITFHISSYDQYVFITQFVSFTGLVIICNYLHGGLPHMVSSLNPLHPQHLTQLNMQPLIVTESMDAVLVITKDYFSLESSIMRTVTVDVQSEYFLNGKNY